MEPSTMQDQQATTDTGASQANAPAAAAHDVAVDQAPEIAADQGRAAGGDTDGSDPGAGAATVDAPTHVAVPVAHVSRIAAISRELNYLVGAGVHDLVTELGAIGRELEQRLRALEDRI